jgi:hypothetical protein
MTRVSVVTASVSAPTGFPTADVASALAAGAVSVSLAAGLAEEADGGRYVDPPSGGAASKDPDFPGCGRHATTRSKAAPAQRLWNVVARRMAFAPFLASPPRSRNEILAARAIRIENPHVPTRPLNLAPLACMAIVAFAPAARAQSANRAAREADSSGYAAPEYPAPSTRWKLVAGGIVATGLFYGAAAGVSYAFPDAPGARDLRTPVVGPWLAIANNGCPADDPDCGRLWVALRTIVTAIDGLAQAGGVGIFLEGVFLPTQEPAPVAKKPVKDFSFSAVPTALGPRGIGIGVAGTF